MREGEREETVSSPLLRLTMLLLLPPEEPSFAWSRPFARLTTLGLDPPPAGVPLLLSFSRPAPRSIRRAPGSSSGRAGDIMKENESVDKHITVKG